MAALPAPDGGGIGLFRGYSTQRNCLLLRWASTRVPNKRKCCKEVSCQSTTKGGLLGPRPSSSFSPPGLGDLSVSTEINQMGMVLTPALPLAGFMGRSSSWCCCTEKRQSIFYPAARFISQSTASNISFCCSALAVAPHCLAEPGHCRLCRLRELVNPPTPHSLLLCRTEDEGH